MFGSFCRSSVTFWREEKYIKGIACRKVERLWDKFVIFVKMKLVIFDLDGTLLNTLEDLAASVNYALHRFGYPEHTVEEYRYFVGNGITKLVERALPEKERTEEHIIQVRAEFLSQYSQHKMDRTKPYAGIPALLEQLRHAGVVLAVASNKYQEATHELIHFYFGDHIFAAVLGQREGIPAKPDPSIVNEILAITGMEKRDTFYVGDSCVDMQTALNGGVIPIGVSWGFRPCVELEENGAIHIVDRPSQIFEIVNRAE